MIGSGRFWVRDLKSNRVFCVEPLENRHEEKIILQPSETVVEDNKKYKGTIKPEESIITKDNGFVNIVDTANPLDYIERLLSK